MLFHDRTSKWCYLDSKKILRVLKENRNQLKFALTTGLLEERQEPNQSVKRTKLKRPTLLPSRQLRQRSQLPNQQEVLRPARRERKRRTRSLLNNSKPKRNKRMKRRDRGKRKKLESSRNPRTTLWPRLKNMNNLLLNLSNSLEISPSASAVDHLPQSSSQEKVKTHQLTKREQSQPNRSTLPQKREPRMPLEKEKPNQQMSPTVNASLLLLSSSTISNISVMPPKRLYQSLFGLTQTKSLYHHPLFTKS